MTKLYEAAVVRFLDKIVRGDTPSDCWGWTGTTYGSNNYARMWTGKKAQTAHGFSFEYYFGPPALGLIIMHTCDTPTCANPAHLIEGTTAENNQDRARKGRSCKGADHWQNKHPERRFTGDKHWTRRFPEKVKRGTSVKKSKVTPSLVRLIRKLRVQGLSQQAIADRSDIPIKQASISSILLGKTWGHVA